MIQAVQAPMPASAPAGIDRLQPTNVSGRLSASGLSAVFSTETSFALFLLSGRFKGLPELRHSPIDLTLLFLVMTWGLVAWNVISGRMKPLRLTAPVVLMILFCEFAVVSLFWSSLDPINLDKVTRFILLTGSGFFVACVIAQDRIRRKRLLGAITCLSAALVLYYLHYRYILGIDLMSPEYSWIDRQTEGGDNYLEYGDNAAILFNVLLTFAAFAPWKQAAAAALGSAVPLVVLLGVGGRGPLALSGGAILVLGSILFVRGGGFSRPLGRLASVIACIAVIGMIGYAAAGSQQFSGHSCKRAIGELADNENAGFIWHLGSSPVHC